MAYTARQIWEAALTETNKTGAPSMLLSDYNYFINKAINQYVNKHYTIYDISQQTTDDLRVLKASAMLQVKNIKYSPEIGGKVIDFNNFGAGLAKMFAGTYEVILPQDYLHMLNCKCIFKMLSDFRCYDKDNYIPFDATRLTADAKSQIDGNAYLTPKPWRPYYCIHNVNVVDGIATNPRDATYNPYGTDFATGFKTDYSNLEIKPYDGADVKSSKPEVIGVNNATNTTLTEQDKTTSLNNGFDRTITLKNPYTEENKPIDIVDVKPAGIRMGNNTGVRCEILCGKDDSVFKLLYVLVDYIKAPQHVRLTQEQIDLIKDTSQIMEFPDYVCQEIINELIMLIMENQSNQRLQTHPQVSQSINYQNQAQQQQQQAQQQARQS